MILKFAISCAAVGLHVSGGVTRDSVPALDSALATITTDTGTFAPGRRDFSRYDSPTLCLAAATGARDGARRTLETQLTRDTLRDTPHDTIGVAAARMIGRACAARFLTSSVAIDDPAALLTLAVVLDDDTLALRVVTAQLVHAATSAQRSTLALTALSSFLALQSDSSLRDESGIWNAAAPRLAHAPLLQAADSMRAVLRQDTAFRTGVRVREMLLQYAEALDSMPVVQHAAEDLLVLMHQAPPHALDAWEMKAARINAYQDLMVVAFLAGTDSMTALAQRIQQAGVDLPLYKNVWRLKTQPATAMSIHDIITMLSPIDTLWDPRTRPVVPRLEADFWYPANESHVVPAPGVVTVIAVSGGGSLAVDRAAMAAHVRQWVSRYPRTALRIVMLDQADDSVAYWLIPGDDDYVNGPMTSVARAKDSHWYYQEYLQLPITVAVQCHPVTFEPRRTSSPPNDPDPLMRNIRQFGPGDVAVIGRDGHLVYKYNILVGRVWSYMPVDRIIAWAVASAPGTTPHTPAGTPPSP